MFSEKNLTRLDLPKKSGCEEINKAHYFDGVLALPKIKPQPKVIKVVMG